MRSTFAFTEFRTAHDTDRGCARRLVWRRKSVSFILSFRTYRLRR
jgi:hypothetical protein